jgi:hypothetical protein
LKTNNNTLTSLHRENELKLNDNTKQSYNNITKLELENKDLMIKYNKVKDDNNSSLHGVKQELQDIKLQSENKIKKLEQNLLDLLFRLYNKYSHIIFTYVKKFILYLT